MLTPKKWETIADRYSLERELARGGMGSVWSARDKKLRRNVAIKLVTPDWSNAEDACERFEHEAQAVARLQSPHVVQIFDYGIERGCPYIVMELLEGEDLRTRLHHIKRLTLEAAGHILVQTAKALSVAHAGGIVHRDLKPGNIFLVRHGDEEIVKVLDFGVALHVDRANLLDSGESASPIEGVMGTPQFMSPEQARGLADLDHRTDLWALGVIIYRALTGRLPFDAGDPSQVIVKVCTETLRPVSELAPDLPRELDGFFARALSKPREARFESARQMTMAFSRISPVTFTTLSMPDPGPMIDEAIRRAAHTGDNITSEVDYDDAAATLAVDIDDAMLADLNTRVVDELPTPTASTPYRAAVSAPALPKPSPPPLSRRGSSSPRRPPPPPRSQRPGVASSAGPQSAVSQSAVSQSGGPQSAPVSIPALPPPSLPPPSLPSQRSLPSLPEPVASAPVSVPVASNSSPVPLVRHSQQGYSAEPSLNELDDDDARTSPRSSAPPVNPVPSFHPTLQGSQVSQHGMHERTRPTLVMALGAVAVGVLLAVVGSRLAGSDDGKVTEAHAAPPAAVEAKTTEEPARATAPPPSEPKAEPTEQKKLAAEPPSESSKAARSKRKPRTATPVAKIQPPKKTVREPEPPKKAKTEPKTEPTPKPVAKKPTPKKAAPKPVDDDVFGQRL